MVCVHSFNIRFFPHVALGFFSQKNCGTTVRTALMQTPGVQWAVVSFNDKQAQIWGDVDLSTAIEAVESVGFDARSAEADLSPAEERKEDTSPDHTIVVTGMNSAIATAVKNALLKVEGVVDVRTDLQAALAHVWGFAQMEDLLAALRSAGYVARDRNARTSPAARTMAAHKAEEPLQLVVNVNEDTSIVELKVTGMSCASCVGNVDRKLMSIPGVMRARIALMAERADVEFNPSQTTIEAIIAGHQQ